MPKLVTPRISDDVTLYTKRYEKFKGVDFSTDPTQVSEARSPICQNLISDLAGFPEKRPGWRVLHTIASPINGLFFVVFASGATAHIAHGGTNLYKWDTSGTTLLYESMNNGRSTSFTHQGKLYILDGTNYLVCTESGGTITVSKVKDGDCFIPTTVIGAPAAGGGTVFEGVNMLTPKRKNSMIGDGYSIKFQLDSKPVDAVESVKVEGVTYSVTTTPWTRTETAVSFLIPSVPTGTKYYLKAGGRTYLVVDASGTAISPTTLTAGNRAAHLLTEDKDTTGEYYLAKPYTYAATNAPTVTATLNTSTFELTDTTYQVDLTAGTVEFALPVAPYSGGSGVDNVIIQFSKAVEGYSDKVEKCCISTWYGYNNDNRIFITGNPDYPNIDYQSGLDDPTYFPDTGYTKIGGDASPIMGYLRQYSTLIVLKGDSVDNAEIFVRTAEMSGDKVIFPTVQGIAGLGAVSKYAFASLRDDPLFLSREGVYAITSTLITQQRVLQNRSFFVDAKLTKEANLDQAVAVTWNGYYLLCVNNHCYIADSRQKTGNSLTEQFGYEWYYWTNIPARVFLERDGDLFFGTADGKICRFNSDLVTMDKYRDDGEPIVARWSTKSDDFKTITRRKTLTKKGSAVMIKPYAHSSVKVYVATEAESERLIKEALMDIFSFNGIDFSRFTFSTLDVPQVVPLNTKLKKFITLQLIFENDALDEGFGVFGAQVQYAIANYVK
jgi:hypothetical protein